MKPEKTRCGGQWTEARFRQFVISLLRAGSMRWNPQHAAIKKAFVKKGPNPKTGRPCNQCKCSSCGGIFAQGDLHADHKDPVVDPKKGFTNWDDYIERLFVEIDGYEALCHACHAKKTAEELKVRVERRRAEKTTL